MNEVFLGLYIEQLSKYPRIKAERKESCEQ